MFRLSYISRTKKIVCVLAECFPCLALVDVRTFAECFPCLASVELGKLSMNGLNDRKILVSACMCLAACMCV